ncbi:MAG: bifunctional diaminohydroxyphosphoribosylaminopyrimidine deaminase/5-amino-6-(5-phosphoribosylamino)uracil reductase RibD, partial [Bacteroidota bacterium]
AQAAGHVAPNPMVGAVLVYNGRIIGEGYHRQYGEAHAEVNCINSVKKEDEELIPQSAMYVSLEPCAHFGKTPPCADLIIKKRIPKVVIGCRDPFVEVNGKGIEKLLFAGIEVLQNILEKECIELNKRFLTFYTRHRPYIILKWAESANGKIGSYDNRIYITNEFTNRIVHKWRSEEASILIGTTTALTDDPSLNVRLWTGPDPVRLIVDMDLSLPGFLHVFDQQQKTIVFNTIKHEEQHNLLYYQVTHDVSLVHQVMHALYQLKLQSVLIEGGAKLLQSFINENIWDEARIITNGELIIANGVNAPALGNAQFVTEEKVFSDRISYFKNAKI